MTVNHVAPVSSGQQDLGRLTILLQVAPPSPNSAKLPENDARKLLGSLSALLEELHAESVRLVVFDLEQQKVIFRKDGFTAPNLRDVDNLVNQMQFGLVDYSTLRNPKGAIDLLTQLMEEERGKLHGSDALVFLGPHMQVHDTIRSGVVKPFRDGPRVFYLKCEPPPAVAWTHDSGAGIRAESATLPPQTPEYDDSAMDQPDDEDHDCCSTSEQPNHLDIVAPVNQQDIIEQLVRHMKGEIIPIRRPSDCARAIQRIARRAKRQDSGAAGSAPEQSVDQPAGSGN